MLVCRLCLRYGQYAHALFRECIDFMRELGQRGGIKLAKRGNGFGCAFSGDAVAVCPRDLPNLGDGEQIRAQAVAVDEGFLCIFF